MKELLKSDTVKASIAAILTSGAAYLTGEIELAAFLELSFGGVIAIFMRRGISKSK